MDLFLCYYWFWERQRVARDFKCRRHWHCRSVKILGTSWNELTKSSITMLNNSFKIWLGYDRTKKWQFFFSSRYRLSIGFLLCSVSFQDWCFVCLLWVILECGLGFISGSYQCSYDLLNLLFPAQTRVLFVDIRTLFTRALIHGRSLLQWWNPLLYLFICFIGYHKKLSANSNYLVILLIVISAIIIS